MDSAIGLLYMGNGNYYDPATGRFLNRNANPNGTNPYMPWGGEPSAAFMAPLALLSLFYSRRKKRGTLDTIIILLVLGVSLSMGLTACTYTTTQTTPLGNVTVTVMPTPNSISPLSYTAIATFTPNPSSTPLGIPTITCTAILLPTPISGNVLVHLGINGALV